MVDNPQGYGRVAPNPVPYTTAIARAMNMQAIVNGWLPQVIGWHCTVSDQFMSTADGALGGGVAAPAIMDFPITYDGVWVPQHGVGTYFAAPVNRIYQKGTFQPNPQIVPAGYRARVNKVSVEVAWADAGIFPQGIWDPGDYTRWSWLRKRPAEAAYSIMPGTKGRPCQSRTLLGAPSFYTNGEFYTTTQVCGPQQIKLPYTAGTTTPFTAGQILVCAGGGTGIIEQSIKTGGIPGAETGFVWLKAGSVTNFAGLTGAMSQLPTAGGTATAGTAVLAEPPATGAISYQQLYNYPDAIMPTIFLEPGDLSFLRVENFTSDTSQQFGVSMSVSGVMWPVGLEGS